MSDTNPGELKHRHDVGHPDHGARATELVTRGIQFALGASILGTLALLIYLLVGQSATP